MDSELQTILTMLGSNAVTNLFTFMLTVRKQRDKQSHSEEKLALEKRAALDKATEGVIDMFRKELDSLKEDLATVQDKHEKCTEDNHSLRNMLDKQGWAMLKLALRFGVSAEDPDFKFLAAHADAVVHKASANIARNKGEGI